METPIPTNHPMPMFETISSLHLFLHPSMPGRKTFLHLKARYPSSHANHTTYQSYTSTDPHQHPSPPQKNHPRADLRVCMPSAAGRAGECRMMASTAQRFPSFYKLFPPAQPRGEVSLWWASVGLGLTHPAPLLSRLHRTEPSSRNYQGWESKPGSARQQRVETSSAWSYTYM